MSPEKTKKLLDSFPLLYQKPIRGIECNDGWFHLLWNLSEKIEAELRSMPADMAAEIYVKQVKEKLGGLRFYLSSRQCDSIAEWVHAAETASYKICETCGNEGRHRTESGWLHVACDEHAHKEADG